MSKKSNPTVIGAFVVGAVALLVVSVTLFGGSELFAKRYTYVAYFLENSKGLRTGSSIMMNGVVIGEVTQVALIIDQTDLVGKTKVTFEIIPENWILQEEGGILSDDPMSGATHEELVNVAGLRATLGPDNLITGRLLIDISFRPDVEAVMRGGDDPPHPEIPTIPSTTQELIAKLQTWVADLSLQFDAETFAKNLQGAVSGANELVNSQDIRETLAGINALTNRPETQNMTATLESTLQELQKTMADANALLTNANAKLDTDLQPIIEKLDAVMAETQQVMAGAKVQVRGESVLAYQLGEALREVQGAARSMREFLDYLESDPNALLKGKRQ